MIPLRSILREEDRQRRLDAKNKWAKLKIASVFLSKLQRTRRKSDLLENTSIRSVGIFRRSLLDRYIVPVTQVHKTESDSDSALSSQQQQRSCWQ